MTKFPLLKGTNLQLPYVADQVKNILKKNIIEGKLKPGDKLPSEEGLVELFHVSNTAIREALGKLAAEGLIEKRRGATGGSFVAGGDSRRISAVVMDCYHLGGLTLEEVVEFRRSIEPIVLEIACNRRTNDDLRSMKKNLDTCKEAIRKGQIERDTQIDFHLLIAEATHNRIITATMSAVIKISREFTLKIPIDTADVKADLEANENFYNCLKRQQQSEARRLMDDHFEKKGWVHVVASTHRK
jgi:DNA-binding FadR family transcriptional regulator